MKIEYQRTDALIPYENNPRINDGAVEAVAASIKEFGFKNPIIVDKNNVIICGHTRLQAAKKLGLEEVPTIRAEDLTEEQVRAFRLADNKTAELADTDFDLLEEELKKIKRIDMSSFGFEKLSRSGEEWFEQRERMDTSREEGNDEYNEFLEKFEAKKTTDDCYTPDHVYEVVAEYVESRFGVDRKNFVRPFFPNGDYQAERYSAESVVVDNPPFSILAEIVDFYVDRGIKFFLFAPGNSTIGYTTRNNVQAICTHAAVTYENGATVVTCFLTNLANDGCVAISDPELYKKIDEANEITLESMRANLPKYSYPVNVVTATKLGYLSKYGQRLEIKRESSCFIRKLDAQGDKGIFGSGLLISEKAAAEKAAAEKAAAEKAAAMVFELSEREKEIIKSLK